MYSIRKVTEDLFWVGANDHRTTLFENIHPIPKGVSYNAYLLMDEKTVLFDTVDWSACRQLLENVAYLCNGKSLDYLVVHHVEPDHSASISAILAAYPTLKVISSAMGFRFMKQYGVALEADQQIVIKENDTISFGKHELKFLSAPMVHWPEVMVSFDTTNGALFSADAFGTFKALDGKLFNDEINFQRDWLDEARRYYTNIVGKYGQNVQGLLKKTSTIVNEIKLICPLHGPVWRNDFETLLHYYNIWSLYEPEENGVLIIYGSMYGNTESAAQALAAKLCEEGITNISVYDVSQTHISTLIAASFKYSHIVLASVTYNADMYPLMHNLLIDMKALNLQKRTFALIENGTWALQAGNAMKKFITEELKDMQILDERLFITASLQNEHEENLKQLTDAIIASVQTK